MLSTINELSVECFLEGWRQVVGEAPAAMLDDRRTMIALLVETATVLAVTDLARSAPADADRRRGRADHR